jgi:hypothetical protein
MLPQPQVESAARRVAACTVDVATGSP